MEKSPLEFVLAKSDNKYIWVVLDKTRKINAHDIQKFLLSLSNNNKLIFPHHKNLDYIDSIKNGPFGYIKILYHSGANSDACFSTTLETLAQRTKNPQCSRSFVINPDYVTQSLKKTYFREYQLLLEPQLATFLQQTNEEALRPDTFITTRFKRLLQFLKL